MSKIISLQVGTPKDHSYQGKTISSSMLRDQKKQSLELETEGFPGDQFTSAAVHGVTDSKVYAMGNNFYQFWKEHFSSLADYGSVGENLTLDHLDESKIFCGDQFQIGSAVMEATSPRFPCTKLNFVFKNDQAMDYFMHRKQSGVYFKVVKPGIINLGDSLTHIRNQGLDPSQGISIAEVYEVLYLRKTQQTIPETLLQKLMNNPFVSEDLVKIKFRK